jgi:FkbM family methyltransferase
MAKHADLIIDVGMHRGEDTAHYLAKGFRVVALEANPSLAADVGERFADELASGRLRIDAVAVAAQAGVVDFAIADDVTIWSSLSEEFVRRNESAGVAYRRIRVPAVRFEDVLREVGIPHYLKIDIEGADMLCVDALQAFDERPDYLSIESSVTSAARPFDAAREEMAALVGLGYQAFKYVDQSGLAEAGFAIGGSGPFGEETPGRWLTTGEALRRARRLHMHHQLGGFGGRWATRLPGRIYHAGRHRLLRRPPVGWYDLHARLEPARSRHGG